MLTPSDFISLPCTTDLVESGIACACRSLAQPGHRNGSSIFDRLRLTVVDVVVELAFRRHLVDTGVPFSIFEAAPFTDPDHFDVSLGGHRCTLKSSLVSRRLDISRLRRTPGLLLQAPALFPLEAFSGSEGKPDDIQIFAFLLGLITASHQEVDKAGASGQPLSLVHPLPPAWRRPSPWVPLENLVLKSECDQPLSLELHGQDADRNFITRTLELPSRLRTPVPHDFFSLLCLRLRQQPQARVGIHSPTRGEAHILQPYEWGNLWVYGMNILLTGWLTRENYRRKATILNPGSHTALVGGISEKNLFVPVEALNPLTPLLHHVCDWAKKGTISE
jgi:hypothetical protein